MANRYLSPQQEKQLEKQRALNLLKRLEELAVGFSNPLNYIKEANLHIDSLRNFFERYSQ